MRSASRTHAQAAEAGSSSPRVPLLVGLVLLAVVVLAAVLVLPGSPTGLRPDPDRDFTAVQQARGDALRAELRGWTLPRLALATTVALLLGLTPLGARLAGALVRVVRGRPVVGAAAAAAVLVTVPALVTLPLSVGASSVLRDAGLTVQPWPAEALDRAQALVVTAVPAAVVAAVVVALARRRPRAWWVPTAVVTAALVGLGSLAYPVVVEPLFSSSRPLPDGPLRDDLLTLAERAGAPVAEVEVSDASTRTTTLNASVAGLGPTRRLVVRDTLLEGVPEAEVRAVVAHELAHVAADDVAVGTALGAGAAAAAVCLLAAALRWRPLLRRAGLAAGGSTSGAGAGPRGGTTEAAADPRAVALVLALVAAGQLLAAPATAAASRGVEARADATAVRLVGATDVIALHRRLAVANVADVTPPALLQRWFGTHPTAPERIAAARAQAADAGEPRDAAGSARTARAR